MHQGGIKMYNIQKIFKNINPETYNVSNIKYGDIGYIFINKGVKFKNLIKITIEEIFEVNEDGIILTMKAVNKKKNIEEFLFIN